jgi:hypothetical protein
VSQGAQPIGELSSSGTSGSAFDGDITFEPPALIQALTLASFNNDKQRTKNYAFLLKVWKLDITFRATLPMVL